MAKYSCLGRILENIDIKGMGTHLREGMSPTVYLVLPVNPDELTDEQLNGVAGGACWDLFYKGCYRSMI